MDQLANLAINESGFTFDPRSGESYRFNETAMKIIGLFKSGHSDVEAAKEIAEKFQISFATAYEDILEFCSEMKQFGVL